MITDWFLSTITLRSSNNLQNLSKDFIILDQNADEKEFKPDFEKLSQINFGDYLSMIACGSSYPPIIIVRPRIRPNPSNIPNILRSETNLPTHRILHD
jgi:hypothetical protein